MYNLLNSTINSIDQLAKFNATLNSFFFWFSVFLLVIGIIAIIVTGDFKYISFGSLLIVYLLFRLIDFLAGSGILKSFFILTFNILKLFFLNIKIITIILFLISLLLIIYKAILKKN